MRGVEINRLLDVIDHVTDVNGLVRFGHLPCSCCMIPALLSPAKRVSSITCNSYRLNAVSQRGYRQQHDAGPGSWSRMLNAERSCKRLLLSSLLPATTFAVQLVLSAPALAVTVALCKGVDDLHGAAFQQFLRFKPHRAHRFLSRLVR